MRWFSDDACRVPSVSAISRTLASGGGGVVLGEGQHGLDDARDRFAVAAADGEQSQVVALAQERLADVEVTVRDHRAAPQGQQVDEDQQRGQEQQPGQREHEIPAGNEHAPERFHGVGPRPAGRRRGGAGGQQERCDGLENLAGERVHAFKEQGKCIARPAKGKTEGKRGAPEPLSLPAARSGIASGHLIDGATGAGVHSLPEASIVGTARSPLTKERMTGKATGNDGCLPVRCLRQQKGGECVKHASTAFSNRMGIIYSVTLTSRSTSRRSPWPFSDARPRSFRCHQRTP